MFVCLTASSTFFGVASPIIYTIRSCFCFNLLEILGTLPYSNSCHLNTFVHFNRETKEQTSNNRRDDFMFVQMILIISHIMEPEY